MDSNTRKTLEFVAEYHATIAAFGGVGFEIHARYETAIRNIIDTVDDTLARLAVIENLITQSEEDGGNGMVAAHALHAALSGKGTTMDAETRRLLAAALAVTQEETSASWEELRNAADGYRAAAGKRVPGCLACDIAFGIPDGICREHNYTRSPHKFRAALAGKGDDRG